MAIRGLIVLLRDDEPPSIAYPLTDTFSEDCEPRMVHRPSRSRPGLRRPEQSIHRSFASL
jgi:hypothetical protein